MWPSKMPGEIRAGREQRLLAAHRHDDLGRLGPKDAEKDVVAGLVSPEQTVRVCVPECEQLPQGFFVHGSFSV